MNCLWEQNTIGPRKWSNFLSHKIQHVKEKNVTNVGDKSQKWINCFFFRLKSNSCYFGDQFNSIVQFCIKTSFYTNCYWQKLDKCTIYAHSSHFFSFPNLPKHVHNCSKQFFQLNLHRNYNIRVVLKQRLAWTWRKLMLWSTSMHSERWIEFEFNWIASIMVFFLVFFYRYISLHLCLYWVILLCPVNKSCMRTNLYRMFIWSH